MLRYDHLHRGRRTTSENQHEEGEGQVVTAQGIPVCAGLWRRLAMMLLSLLLHPESQLVVGSNL